MPGMVLIVSRVIPMLGMTRVMRITLKILIPWALLRRRRSVPRIAVGVVRTRLATHSVRHPCQKQEVNPHKREEAEMG